MSEDEDFGAAAPPEQEIDVGELIDEVLKLTDSAMALRQRNNLTRALKQMERAISTFAGHEHGHPALAVEGARARLNFGAMLSACNRHPEALEAVRSAKQTLESVLVWAEDCGPDDLGVSSIAEEARCLNCAALVAEAIELDFVASYGNHLSDDESRRSTQKSPQRKGQLQIATAASAAAIAESAVAALLHRQELYAAAQEHAEKQLPQSHPMKSLVKKLSAETTLPSPLKRSPGSRGRPQQRGVSLPSLTDAVKTDPPLEVKSPAGGERSSGELPDITGAELAEAAESSAGPKENTEGTPAAKASRRHSRTDRRGVPFRRGEEERSDMFTEFIRNIEADKTARLNEKNPRLQEEAKKKLGQLHRTTQLLIELSNDEDLKDKRYSKIGHKVFMNNLTKENKCRSDPALTQEARRAGGAPEVILVKKLNKVLYKKPPTPTPPARQESKPLVGEDVKSVSLFGKK